MFNNLKNLIGIFKFGGLFNFLLFGICIKDPAMHKAVADLNRAVDEDERLLQEGYGKQWKLHRYSIIDWFIPAEGIYNRKKNN